jgi:hypothetical protein
LSEDTSSLTIRFEDTEVTDVEVAAVSVAVAALTAGSAGAAGGVELDPTGRRSSGPPTPAWRAASLLEGTGDRRLGSLATLRDAHAGQS